MKYGKKLKKMLNVEDNEGAEEVKQPFIHMDKILAFLAKKSY